MERNVLITGGAGFIGSTLIRHLINNTNYQVINVDKLTYAGHLESLEELGNSERYIFEKVDICDAKEIRRIIRQYKPDSIMHLAAESHVDRSIDGSAEFINTNIVGTHTLLEEAKVYWKSLDTEKANAFRFLHVSTDEVYGELDDTGLFTEETSYDPRSPYSSSKAASDHLVRAWFHTYGLPTLITNCSNNYGPFQFPEKLIPVAILKALQGREITVYGKGENVRDWLYVDDHIKALFSVLLRGKPGETYNIGGHNEKKNIDVVNTICYNLDQLNPKSNSKSYKEQITFVPDRPGHDFRYAIDASKVEKELGWRPEETFESGMLKTIQWYLNNIKWCEAVTKNNYSLERLGRIYD